jgi:hypothetical protein
VYLLWKWNWPVATMVIESACELVLVQGQLYGRFGGCGKIGERARTAGAKARDFFERYGTTTKVVP